MTTIAYRNGVVAADSQETTSDGRITQCDKLFRVKDYIIATAGDSYTGLIFLQWFKDGANREYIPDLSMVDLSEDFECLVVSKDRIYTVNRFFQEYEINLRQNPFIALGWGSPYAIGAMEVSQKVTAKQAVQIACKFDCYSGGSVKTMKIR